MALGARADTFSGLTGLGDLVLSATGELSRNRRVGLEIGAGRKLDDILAGGMTAEGVRAARSALARARALNVDLPITAAVCAVLFDGVVAHDGRLHPAGARRPPGKRRPARTRLEMENARAPETGPPLAGRSHI